MSYEVEHQMAHGTTETMNPLSHHKNEVNSSMSVDELDEILGVFNSKGKSVSVSDCCDAIINLNRNKWECSACHKPCGGSENWHVKNVNDAKVEQAKQAILRWAVQALKELKEEVIGEVPSKMNTDNWKYDRRVAELKLWQHQAIDNKIKALEEV